MDQLAKYIKPELIVISESKKLRDFTPEERTMKSASLVYKLLNLLGVKDGNTEHHTELVRHVTDFYGHFTFEQIEKAFGMFISRQLKIQPFQQLNAVVFGNVMQEFDDYTKEQTKNYRLAIQEFKAKAIPMTQEEKDDIMQKAIEKAIDVYKQTGTIEMASSKYDWLDAQGKLQGKLTKDEWHNRKRSKYASVKSRLIASYSSMKANTQDEKTTYKNVLIELQNAKSGKIISQCKLELLEHYFDNLK